jgi:cytochrome c oxidase assembly protein subunit 15
MSPTESRAPLLRRLALCSAVLMLATIVLSAFMRLSQAGLGCADWPACYGQLGTDEPQRWVEWARLAHRVVASAVLVLVVVMVVLSRGSGPSLPPLQRQRRLAWLLLALALALAALGVITPGARVPAVAMGNLIGGFAMLALCWRLAAPQPRPGAAGAATGLGVWGALGLLLLLVQVGLGALVSATHSALACLDLGDCSRAAQAAGWDWGSLHPWRAVSTQGLPMQQASALTQWMHRLGAWVLLPLLGLLALLAWHRGRRSEAVALGLLTLLQGLAGGALATAGFPLALVLTHNLLAALLLAVLARLT